MSALTYLSPKMIEQPANIAYLSAARLIATNVDLKTVNVNTLSAYNTYINNIINNTDVFGNLTVYGAITALSGIVAVNTFNTSTSALSVINIGVGPALYVSQGSSLNSVATFIGTNQEILRINNIDPNFGQPTVLISKGPAGKSLSANGISIFENVEASLATITTLNAASATISIENTTISNIGTVNANAIKTAAISANSLTMPNDSYAFFGNMTVYGQINALSGIQNIASFVSQTSSLSVVSVAQAPALYVKQTGGNPVTSFYGNTTEVLRVNNPAVAPTAPGVVVTGSVSSSNIIQAAGGTSNNWNSVYTTVQNTSSTWTGGNNAFTNVQTNSANWQSAYSSIVANATNWTNTYTTVQNNSNNWTAAYTNIQSNSAIYLPTKILKTANFTAESSFKYLVNTTSGVVYGTLPTPPITGTVISFEDPFSTWGTNNFIVQGNGSNIESSSNALSCDVIDSSFILTYVGGTRGWKVS